jgi:hypothetical protein
MRLRWIPLALLALAPFLALALRPGVEAQVRAVIVLSTTLKTPVLSWTVRQLTDEPRIEEVEIAGSPATLARPGSKGPWPRWRDSARHCHPVSHPRPSPSSRSSPTAIRAASTSSSRPAA